MQPTLYRMVFIDNINDNVPRHIVHLVQRIGIHRHFIIILIQRIAKRGIDFFYPIMTDFQVLRQNQITFAVREIGFMCYHGRVSRHLLHIFLVVQVIYLELCVFRKHSLLRFNILLHNSQLRFKFIVQKHPPYLRSVRLMLRDTHKEIPNRRIIMRCGCLPHNVRPKRERDAAGITLFISKDFRCPVLPDFHRFSGIKIISAIFLCVQGRYQPCRKPCTG